ncbi:hypothetical protein GDO78_020877 [Eleutherodactylus coqui]|uniref:Centrosomal protein of 70 kDa n=1 Tax=Eleutherodactylus coqui TaxID=57060 RepID=A0A8J6EHD3_ELECQ|nr:hypothetical protein GDO78_020877 [Eleutherodactylus coqui]
MQQDRAGRQEQRADDLQNILESVKAKIRDLEDDFLCKLRQQKSEVTSLLKAKEAAHENCQEHKEKLREQDQSIAQLRKRLSQAAAAEEKRLENRRKTFLRLVKRQPQENNPFDQQPSVREFRVYKQQMRKMEKILLQNNIRWRGATRENKEAEPHRAEVSALKSLPDDEGQRHLQDVCRALGVQEVKDLLPSSSVSPHMLQALISHFQKLFDVPSMSGIYPRMNEVYSKLGEMNNAMKNLRCLLGLDDTASAGTVVNAVGRLNRELEEGGGHRLQGILGMLDIDR